MYLVLGSMFNKSMRSLKFTGLNLSQTYRDVILMINLNLIRP